MWWDVMWCDAVRRGEMWWLDGIIAGSKSGVNEQNKQSIVKASKTKRKQSEYKAIAKRLQSKQEVKLETNRKHSKCEMEKQMQKAKANEQAKANFAHIYTRSLLNTKTVDHFPTWSTLAPSQNPSRKDASALHSLSNLHHLHHLHYLHHLHHLFQTLCILCCS